VFVYRWKRWQAAEQRVTFWANNFYVIACDFPLAPNPR
jgi:hypothetical protein